MLHGDVIDFGAKQNMRWMVENVSRIALSARGKTDA